jgi:hypothetical protein
MDIKGTLVKIAVILCITAAAAKSGYINIRCNNASDADPLADVLALRIPSTLEKEHSCRAFFAFSTKTPSVLQSDYPTKCIRNNYLGRLDLPDNNSDVCCEMYASKLMLKYVMPESIKMHIEEVVGSDANNLPY